MKPVKNPVTLWICPKTETCPTDHRYVGGLGLCGHHVPHERRHECTCDNCGQEHEVACTQCGEVE